MSTAEEYYRKSLKAANDFGEKKGISKANTNLASVFLNQGNTERAIYYGNEAMRIAVDIGYLELIQAAAKFLSDLHSNAGNYRKALAMYDIEIKMKDSLLNEEKTRLSILQKLKLEYQEQKLIDEKKQEKVEALEQEEKGRQKLALYLSISGLILLLVFGSLIVNRILVFKKQKVIIAEHKEELIQLRKNIE
jgi:hypothetical protein